MATKHSVIQSTMIKITVLIFCILLLLYFLIARIYWDKEVLERQSELLTVATAVEMQFQTNYQTILEIKENQELDNDEKVDLINSLLEIALVKTTKDNPNVLIGYYDKDLDSIAFNSLADSAYFHDSKQQEISQKIGQSGTPEFFADSEVTHWDGKGTIAVAVPVLDQGETIGHAWAMIKAGQIFYDSYLEYSKVFIPSIIIWLLVLAIIKRNIVKIQTALDAFTERIINDQINSNEDLSLPELKPVYERIRGHLDNLELLNNRLEESNSKLITIMEGIADGFFSVDKEWRFTFVNEETKRILGKENTDFNGKNAREEILSFLGGAAINKLHKVMEENTPLHWEEQFPSENIYYEIHAYPFAQGLNVFFRDITELKQRENELVRLERLNLIGQMAAGISHEVRNPLTTVRGFLQMLESKEGSARNKEYMELMISEIDRANKIITDFLSLAKANADCTRQENINEIILRIFPMLQADAFNSNKDIILNLGDVPQLELNEPEIRQLILNLVRNGLEETEPGGEVGISTCLQDNGVVLEIKDQGKGLPAEIQAKMGTPFITTKETGTGLGLAISIGIVRRHKASFEFETGNSGTTFYITFPLA